MDRYYISEQDQVDLCNWILGFFYKNQKPIVYLF